MPVPPGSPQGMVPRGEDWIVRRFEENERKEIADIASVSKSFQTTTANITSLLANQITQRSNYANDTNFALTTAVVTRCSHTITIPTGYTDGAYSATGSCGVLNNTGSTQYVFLRVYAAAAGYLAWGSRQQVAVAAGFYGTLSATLIREYDVALTPGANVTFYVEISASAAMAADASNYAFCEELVTFTR